MHLPKNRRVNSTTFIAYCHLYRISNKVWLLRIHSRLQKIVIVFIVTVICIVVTIQYCDNIRNLNKKGGKKKAQKSDCDLRFSNKCDAVSIICDVVIIKYNYIIIFFLLKMWLKVTKNCDVVLIQCVAI